jgi:hypothetical protein
MVYYVTVVSLLITLLMNMFTNIVLEDCDSDEVHADY